MLAVANKQLECVKILLVECDTDRSAVDQNNWSVLLLAAKKELWDIVKALIQEGAHDVDKDKVHISSLFDTFRSINQHCNHSAPFLSGRVHRVNDCSRKRQRNHGELPAGARKR